MPELYNSGTTAQKDHTATYTSSHRDSLFDKMWYMYVHMLAYHVICFLFLHLIKTILRNYLRTIKSKDRWKSYNMLGSNLSHRYRIGGTIVHVHWAAFLTVKLIYLFHHCWHVHELKDVALTIIIYERLKGKSNLHNERCCWLHRTTIDNVFDICFKVGDCTKKMDWFGISVFCKATELV